MPGIAEVVFILGLNMLVWWRGSKDRMAWIIALPVDIWWAMSWANDYGWLYAFPVLIIGMYAAYRVIREFVI